jgi:hypothetical protein
MKRIKNVFYLLFISTLLLSCGTKAEKLQFSEFEIKNGDGVTGVTVNKNGDIKISGEDVGSINTNGTLNDKDGNLLAKITDDNFLQGKDGKNLVKIDENGKMDNGSGMFIEWSESGELLKGNEKTGMIIKPVDKKSFQAASIILYLHLSFK